MSEVTLNGGRNLIAGDNISTRQLNLAADTYYVGMLLKYLEDGTVAANAGNTGDGTVTDLEASSEAIVGDYVLTVIEAVTNGGVFKLEDPNGNIVESTITMDAGAGAASTVEAGGLTFTITDGSTDFAAGDFFTLTIAGDGTYQYTSISGEAEAIFNGTDERVLSSAGVDDCIVAGDIYNDGLVDNSGSAITLTNVDIAALRKNGFYIKEA